MCFLSTLLHAEFWKDIFFGFLKNIGDGVSEKKFEFCGDVREFWVLRILLKIKLSMDRVCVWERVEGGVGGGLEKIDKESDVAMAGTQSPLQGPPLTCRQRCK
jgi:hypothetical protein